MAETRVGISCHFVQAVAHSPGYRQQGRSNYNTLSNPFNTWCLLRRHLDVCRSITTASSQPWMYLRALALNRGVQGKSRIQRVGWRRRTCDGDVSLIVFIDDLSSHKKFARPPLHIRTGGRRVGCQLLGSVSLSTMCRATCLIPTEIHSRRVRSHSESSAHSHVAI